MKLRLILTIALLLTATFASSSTAHADLVTTAYVETGQNNREIMRWDFHCDSLFTCSGSPAAQQAWSSEVGVILGLQQFLRFTSTHLAGPNDLIDLNPAFNFTARLANLNRLPVQDAFTQLTTLSVVHPAIPETHLDIYTVFARRDAQGEFDFILTSAHVPEPTAMLLLGTGLAAIAVKLRKRRGLTKE